MCDLSVERKGEHNRDHASPCFTTSVRSTYSSVIQPHRCLYLPLLGNSYITPTIRLVHHGRRVCWESLHFFFFVFFSPKQCFLNFTFYSLYYENKFFFLLSNIVNTDSICSETVPVPLPQRYRKVSQLQILSSEPLPG